MAPTRKPISLDGSTLEGGGQLVRVAFSLSAITGVPVHVYNIRANRMAKGRSKARMGGGRGSGTQRRGEAGGESGGGGGGGGGGAKESHLAALLWLAGKCDAYVEGAEIGSHEVLFVPGAGGGRGNNKKGKGGGAGDGLVDLEGTTINLERPGSTCLILQCILPYLLFASSMSGRSATSTIQQDSSSQPSEPDALDTSTAETSPSTDMTELTLHGGTNVSKAMTTDYVQHVFLPTLRRIVGPGLPDVSLETVRRGWAGGASQIGEVKVRVARCATAGPVKMERVTAVDRGDIEKISVVIVADGEMVREGIISGLRAEIAMLFDPNLPVEIIVNEDSGDVRRLYVLLVAHTTNGYRLGRDFLGSGRRPRNAAEQRKIIEECVKSVVREMNAEVKRGGCVDEFMQDQIVVFQALGRGEGRVDGGLWRENGSGKGVDVEVGDEGGSLHARTVRWVCERILRGLGGVEFREGGHCKGVGWNWEKIYVDGDGVNLDGERNDQPVEADMKKLDLGKGS